jgi:hypothetical protein
MMPKTPITTDPNALRSLIHGMGGSVIPAPTFQFDLPLDKCNEVIPRINDLGIGVRRISSRIEQHPTRLRDAQTIETLELYRRGD